MPVETQLCENEQVSYFKMSDPWTLEELFKGFALATAYRDEIHRKDPNRRVHTFVDLMDTTNPPPGAMRGRKIPALGHPTRGEMVVAVKHELPRSLVKAMFKVMHAEAQFFESRDEAWAYLRAIIQNSSVKTGTDN